MSTLPRSGAGTSLARPRVLYIMGAGRSGSTILGVALGNHEGAIYAGELDKWLMRSGVPPLSGEERVAFWERVRELVDGADMFGLQAGALERSSSLFRASRLRARRRLRGRYRDVAEQLYRAIASVSGATHVVDSSHYPLRARELQGISGIELYLIFLVRDPHGVVQSFGRSDVRERRFGLPTTNAYLWLTHLVALSVFLRHPRERRLLVKYEQLLAEPQAVLGAITSRAGLRAATPDLERLHTGVPIQGNRLLRAQSVALQGGAAAPKKRLVTSVLQLPWRVLFAALARRNSPAGEGAGRGIAAARLHAR
jgi:Sulfotransferase family